MQAHIGALQTHCFYSGNYKQNKQSGNDNFGKFLDSGNNPAVDNKGS